MRATTALAAAALMLALTGCGSLAGSGSTPPAAAGGQPVSISFMAWAGMGPEAIQGVAESYTRKHPNVHVTLKDAKIGGLTEKDGKANTAMLDGVDVALLPAGIAASLQQAGALKDLSDLRLPVLETASAPLVDELGRVNGKRYGVPVSLTPSVIYADDQALAQAGVKLPQADWTLQDLEQTVLALKAAGRSANLPVAALLDPILHAYGGQAYDSSRQVWALDTPEARQGLAEIARLVKAGVLSADGQMMPAVNGKNAPGLLALPPGAMIKGIAGTTMPMPRGPKGRGTPVNAVLAVVNASSAHADVAADFVRELLANPAAQLAMARAGIRPISADGAAQAAWRESVGEQGARVSDLILEGAFAQPEVPMDQAVQGLLPYLDGSSSLDKVLSDLQQTLQSGQGG